MKTMFVLIMLVISVQVQAQTVKCSGSSCPDGSANTGTMGEIVGGGVQGAETVDVGCAQKILNVERTLEDEGTTLPVVEEAVQAKPN